MYWSLSSIPCQIYCAGHIVVLSNSFCCVTNYPNHRLNLGSLKLGSFLLGSLMQLKSGIPCIGWDCGYPKSWLSWMSQTTHSYSWQVMLHYWLGAQLGPFYNLSSLGLNMWPHHVAWLPHSKVASDRTSHMASQGFKCKCPSEQNASPALESVQDLYWLQATGYRFKGWGIGPVPVSQWGWVVRPHSRRVCEMGDFAGFFRKRSPMLFQSIKFSTILRIFGNYLMHFSPPLLPLGSPTIQMFDHLYWCFKFLFNFLNIFIFLSYYPKISVLVTLKLMPYYESLYCTPLYNIVYQLYLNFKKKFLNCHIFNFWEFFYVLFFHLFLLVGG